MCSLDRCKTSAADRGGVSESVAKGDRSVKTKEAHRRSLSTCSSHTPESENPPGQDLWQFDVPAALGGTKTVLSAKEAKEAAVWGCQGNSRFRGSSGDCLPSLAADPVRVY